jgi:hypothetical protein
VYIVALRMNIDNILRIINLNNIIVCYCENSNGKGRFFINWKYSRKGVDFKGENNQFAEK